jgi:hypothetical protein
MDGNVGTGQADNYFSSIEIDPIPDDRTYKPFFSLIKKEGKENKLSND